MNDLHETLLRLEYNLNLVDSQTFDSVVEFLGNLNIELSSAHWQHTDVRKAYDHYTDFGGKSCIALDTSTINSVKQNA